MGIAKEKAEKMILWDDFEKIEMRVGTILKAEKFPEAKKPVYKLEIDFGEYGIKKSSAQITDLYSTAELVNRQVIAVTNFPSKQIAHFSSECLVLGVILADRTVVLLQPEQIVGNGLRIA
ncbi:MAG: tRNA-binding protein [Candidatus Woesearchaeota archaeon]